MHKMQIDITPIESEPFVTGGGEDPQLSKSMNALKWVFKSG